MTRSLRIIMVSGNTPPAIDGVCHYTGALLSEMRALRPDWEWLWVGRRARWFYPPLVTEKRLSVVRPAHTWGRLGTLLATMPIRLLRPDIVHIQDQIHSFHETGAAVRIAKAARGHVITTLHEFHVELPSVRHTIELVRCSAAIVANDRRTTERCTHATGRVPDFTWWSGTSVRPLNPTQEVQRVPFLVTTFGLLSGIKAVDLVYEALVRVREKVPELRWQIIGPFDPTTNPFHAELKRRFSKEWIRFTGVFWDLDGMALRTALGSSELMLLPFTDGASPRRTTLQTAWAFGLPVVTTPPEVVEPDVADGVNCLLVREPTIEKWADTVQRLITDPDLRGRLRAGSLKTADQFRWDRLARLHVEFYDRFARGRRALVSA